jgi:hypothetical protein
MRFIASDKTDTCNVHWTFLVQNWRALVDQRAFSSCSNFNDRTRTIPKKKFDNNDILVVEPVDI